jgi:hypothetical protein
MGVLQIETGREKQRQLLKGIHTPGLANQKQ